MLHKIFLEDWIILYIFRIIVCNEPFKRIKLSLQTRMLESLAL